MDFEKYTARWQEQVRTLADQVFGDGYFPRPSEIAREPETHMFLCTEDDDALIGFAHGSRLPARGLSDFLEARIKDIPADTHDADEQGTLGVIERVAVDPGHWGEGVGSQLLTILHDALVGHGADKLIATFKRGAGTRSVDKLMGRLGFEPWTRHQSYWRESCDAGTFKCVHRGNRCSCEALLYRKAVY